MDEIKAIIEALIFTSETPISTQQIEQVLQTAQKDEILLALNELMNYYEHRQGGFYLQEVAGGYQFRSRADFSAWIRKLYKGKSSILTMAAMETLSIIAYRQPVLKSEIDRIRGVDAGGSIRNLIEKKLVKMLGRKDVPGKPIIYGTTKKFLEVFNLKDLSELPTLNELKDLDK